MVRATCRLAGYRAKDLGPASTGSGANRARMSETVIVTPELSSTAGGVAGYTFRLLENWPASANLRVLVSDEASDAASFSYSVAKLRTDRSQIVDQLPQNGSVLVQ